MTTPASHFTAADQQVPAAPSLAITVPAEPGEVSGIRRAVGLLGSSAGLDGNRLSDVALAVGEACANSVVHAYTDRERGLLHVTADVTPAGLEVIVADEGRGMVPRNDSPGLGLGLPLMAALTTELKVGALPTGGTQIRMLFAPKHAGPGGAWVRDA